MKLSIFFCPNQSKANKKNGTIPIYMRLMLNRQKAEISKNHQPHYSFLASRKMVNITLKKVNSFFAYDFRDYLLGTDARAGRVGMKHPYLFPLFFDFVKVFNTVLKIEIMDKFKLDPLRQNNWQIKVLINEKNL